MKNIANFANKKVLVLGLAKSGESAARLLDKLGTDNSLVRDHEAK